MKTLISGGGTGGHIYPALAVINNLRKLEGNDQEFLWIGNSGEIEEILVPREGIPLATIHGGGLVGLPWWQRMVNAAKLMTSMIAVNRIMTEFKADVLFMTGGYVNLPVAIIARLRKLPAVIFLPDIEPALSIKTLSRIVNIIACSTEESKRFFGQGKTITTGYPVREDLLSALDFTRENALSRFNLADNRKTLFVFGGSRGARSINRALISALPLLLERLQVIHVSGTLDWDETKSFRQGLDVEFQSYYRPYAYLHEDMGAAFRAADLVVARAGASMLGECPAFGLPAILVPYPHAWQYQKVNADYLAAKGAAITIADESLSDQLLPAILDLFDDKAKLQAMSSAAKVLDKPDSTSQLAKILLDLGHRNNG